MACPWKFLVSPEKVLPDNRTPLVKSFAEAVSATCAIQLDQLPPKVIVGDTVCVKITQPVYEKEQDACQRLLHGRVTMQKSDAPLTSKALKSKLMTLWPNINNWSVAPLGKGCFEFQIYSIEDMRKIWSQGVVNLKPWILRLFRWSKDFNSFHQVQTHAQVWVRLMHLPREYWQYQTFIEIASGLGSPLVIDDATQARLFRLYARVLVDVDLS